MTEKLYEKDSHLSHHTATVLSCERDGDAWRLVLDRSAFFPEGGGQASDTGTVGGATVSRAVTVNGDTVHTVDRELPVGAVVECAVDMSVRFPRMQCHSGEHIVSGLIHTLYGFNNVGFHMGSKDITLDIDGELSEADIERVELLANKAVAENVPVRAYYPTPEEAARLDYRSKLDIGEGLRLVEIGGYDLCACCAPHVERTGEIGMIKLLEHIRYKGGMRLHMLCGFAALEDYRRSFAELSAISELLSAKKDGCAAAVEHLQGQLADAEYREKRVIRAAVLADAEKVTATDGDLVFIEPAELRDGLRELVSAALPKCGGICAAFAGDDAGGYSFVMGSAETDLREVAAEVRSELCAKCGGTADMIQGSARASAEEIREYFRRRQTADRE